MICLSAQQKQARTQPKCANADCKLPIITGIDCFLNVKELLSYVFKYVQD